MKNNFLLIDMDNFFPSCEVIDRKISNDVPIIVGGYFARSVVSSCNNVAKNMGVKSAMPYFMVKKICPNAVYIQPNFRLYEKFGIEIEKILINYTKNIQKISIDEWLLNFSESKKFLEEQELAQFIKTKIFQNLGLESSIGIGNNFFNAKMASYYAKPFGVFKIDNENFKEIVWKIPIEQMYMIGTQTAKILKKININTIGDLANYQNQNYLFDILGKKANNLLANAKNEFNLKEAFVKKNSFSSSTTFLHNEADYDELVNVLKKQFQTIYRKMKIEDKLTKTISLLLKLSGKDQNKQLTFDFYTNKKDFIWNKLLNLFDDNWNNQSLKGIGCSIDNLIDHFKNNPVQNLFSDPVDIDLTHKVNRKLGYKAVYYAKNF